MKMYERVDVQIDIFLTSVLLGGGWLALSPGKSPRYPLYSSLGGPQSRSERHGEVKIPYPTGTRTPELSVVENVASPYTDCTIPAPHYYTYIHNKSIDREEGKLGKFYSPWGADTRSLQAPILVGTKYTPVRLSCWNVHLIR
jgi:hypothetical protein